MTRTASIGSRVPPAVTTTRVAGEIARGRARRSAAATMSVGIGEPAGADVAAGQPADAGLDDVHAAAAQRGEVLDDGRVLPHLGVHRRADEHRRPRGEQRVRQQVGGEAGGVGADHPGRGRGDDDEVGGLAEPGVRDRDRAVPQLGLHGLAGERAERRRGRRTARRPWS